jgi:hypothetical protein
MPPIYHFQLYLTLFATRNGKLMDNKNQSMQKRYLELEATNYKPTLRD